MTTASSATLATLRDRVEVILQDSTNATYATGDIDEAITQALHRYQQTRPRQAIGTIALAAAGREIDISSLTGYVEVLRVWWDYTAASPEHWPNWRSFQVWPGDLLYIRDEEEPANGDNVRVWYTLPHTLNGLASASATTFDAQDESTIATGAAGFAALFRAQEVAESVTADGGASRNLREWAVLMLDRFEAELAKIAAQQAANHSGLAPLASLDRWDVEGDW